MRIYLTGASGFVGSNLAHVFAREHRAEVVAPAHEHVDLTEQGVHRARPNLPRGQDAGFGYLVASLVQALRRLREEIDSEPEPRSVEEMRTCPA